MKKLVLLFLLFGGCACNSVENTKKYLNVTCIGGHVYYVAYNNYGSSLAPKLQDDGRPCPCQELSK